MTADNSDLDTLSYDVIQKVSHDYFLTINRIRQY